MAKVTISIYSIHIENMNYKAGDKDRMVDLNKFSKFGIVSLFRDALIVNLDKYKNLESKEKAFKVDDISDIEIAKDNNISKFNYVQAKIKSGNYGYISEIVDIDSDGEVTHNKSAKEAEVLPFTVKMCVPEGEVTKGILLFQNIGSMGIKTLVVEEFETYIKENVGEGFKLRVNTLSTKEYINRLLKKSNLLKLSLIGYKRTQNRDNRLDKDRGVISYDSCEYILKKPVVPLFKENVERYFNKNIEISNIIEIRDFEYENIKAEIESEGNHRVLNFDKLDRLLIHEDVTKSVLMLDGQISESKLNEKFKDLSFSYLKEMKLID